MRSKRFVNGIVKFCGRIFEPVQTGFKSVCAVRITTEYVEIAMRHIIRKEIFCYMRILNPMAVFSSPFAFKFCEINLVFR